MEEPHGVRAQPRRHFVKEPFRCLGVWEKVAKVFLLIYKSAVEDVE
jgi:hypothetical protein